MDFNIDMKMHFNENVKLKLKLEWVNWTVRERLIRKNGMHDVQKVQIICIDLSFGHSQYRWHICVNIFHSQYASTEQCIQSFRSLFHFFLYRMNSFLFSVWKKSMHFFVGSRFFGAMPLLYLHRNVCMECNWMLYFACNALQ